MKKTLIVILGLAIASTLILGYLLDDGNYSRERQLWLIQRQFQRASNRSKPPSPEDLTKIIDQYDRFLKRYPRSPLTSRAHLLKGEVYLFQNNYAKARRIFEEVVATYNYNAEVVAQAMVLTGRSYEQEGDWKNARSVYDKIIKDYPLTVAGFSVPAYLGYYFLSKGFVKEANQAFDDAVNFYENTANYYPNSPLEYTALRMVSECRIAQKRWDKALETTQAWMFKYPSNIMLFEAIKTINDVCIGHLKEYDCAIDTYSKFILQNPEHPIRPMLQKMINNLQTLKRKTPEADEK